MNTPAARPGIVTHARRRWKALYGFDGSGRETMRRRTSADRPGRRAAKGTAARSQHGKTKVRAQRLPREERERRILEGAATFFATEGLSGDTRELARRLHITHPLLFRYFGTKEGLLERVYEEVYMRRWNPTWEERIKDRSVPLRTRMASFYNDYARAILSYEWVRIFLYSGLRNANFHRRFLENLREQIFVPLCGELRHELGLPGLDEIPATQDEIELIWGSHTKIFYYGVRKWVYQLPVPGDISKLIELDLDGFFAGAPAVIRARIGARAHGVEPDGGRKSPRARTA
jgi:AcrR family transcriptional regulator